MGQNPPMEPLKINDVAILRPYTEEDAAELTALVAANREHLAPWLPWAATYGHQDSVDYIAKARARLEAEEAFEGAIVVGEEIVGGAGLHAVDRLNRSTAIGYWLAAEAQGSGLMTATVRALIDHAFGPWDLHRVVIEAVVDNARSRAIPERLGFTEEGVLKEAKLVRGRYEDAALYAMLAPDWRPTPRVAIGSE
jgi:ribosomal-protein-serine acetyltransferase